MGNTLVILFSGLTVAAASALLLSSDGRRAAAGWLAALAGVIAIETMWRLPSSFLLSSAALLVAAGLVLYGFRALFLAETDTFLLAGGWFRRAVTVGAVWTLSLLLLRSAHRTAPFALTDPSPLGTTARYWTLFVAAALFGLGLLSLCLRRETAFSALAAPLLVLGPALELAVGGDQGLALLLTAAAVAQLALALWLARRLEALGAGRDTERWEELRG